MKREAANHGTARAAGLPPIALIGMMGAGKSVVGQVLAERLGRPFADTDRLIEVEAGQAIRDLFAKEGEAAFRAREQLLIDRIAESLSGYVLALGGGMFVGEANVTRIRAVAFTVWLRARVDTLVSRLGSRARIERPLLDGREGEEERLAQLLAARTPWYGRAHLKIDTDGLDVDQVAALVAAKVEQRMPGGGPPCA